MRPFHLLLVVLAPSLAACAHVGDGVVRHEPRPSSGEIDRVSATGSTDVEVTVGGATNVEVVCDGNLAKYIRTEVQDRTLVVTNDRMIALAPRGPCAVRVTLPSLVEIETSGSADVKVVGPAKGVTRVASSGSGNITVSELEGPTVRVETSGSGDVAIGHLVAQSLDVQTDGSGGVQLAGVAERARLACSGSGDVHAHELKAMTGVISSSGSCDVALSTSQSVVADTSGSGDVHIGGRPPARQVSSSGSGSISFE